MKIHILVYSDGYGIYPVAQDINIENLKSILKEKFEERKPEEWISEWEEISYLNDTDAILYANGEDVYVWNILTYNLKDILPT